MKWRLQRGWRTDVETKDVAVRSGLSGGGDKRRGARLRGEDTSYGGNPGRGVRVDAEHARRSGGMRPHVVGGGSIRRVIVLVANDVYGLHAGDQQQQHRPQEDGVPAQPALRNLTQATHPLAS